MLTTAFPIFCEAVVEQTYPIAEGTNAYCYYRSITLVQERALDY